MKQPMAFDIEGARKAGYSDAEIAQYLGQQSSFDTDAALKSGYSPSEVIGHLLSSGKSSNQADSIAPSTPTSVELTKTRAQKIAEMDAATDPMNPGYMPSPVSVGEVPKAKKAAAPERTWADVGKDALVVAGKGAVGLPQSIAGIADLAQMATPNYWAKAVMQSVQSGEIEMPKTGQISKALESAGVRFDDAQKYLDSLYSEAQQQANKEVRSAEGFLPTVKAAIENPSVITTTVGESLPQMLGGASIARGALTMAPKLAPWAAGALGEGTISAGSAQSQIQSQTEDGLTTPKQSFAALATGTGTALIGGAAGKFAQGKLAQRLGVADIDTMLAAGKLSKNPAGFAKAVAASGISEGVFEELPQSVQEQILQNYALDKPLTEGVGNAAALGLLSGTTMGGTAGGFNAAVARSRVNTPDAVQAEVAQQIADEVVNSEINRAQRNAAIESIGRAESVDQAIESAKQALSVPVQSSQEIADRILEIEQQYAAEQLPQLDIEKPAPVPAPFANDAVADVELARDGSLKVIGDTEVIVRQLEKAGVVSVLPTESGVVVGPAEAAQAQAVLAQDVTNADLRNDGVASVEALENAGPSQQTGSAADAVNSQVADQTNTAQPAFTVSQAVASPGAAADAQPALEVQDYQQVDQGKPYTSAPELVQSTQDARNGFEAKPSQGDLSFSAATLQQAFDARSPINGNFGSRSEQSVQSMQATGRSNNSTEAIEELLEANDGGAIGNSQTDFVAPKYKQASDNQVRRADTLLAAVRQAYPSVKFRAVAIPVSKKGARMAAVKDMARRYFNTDVVYVQFDGKPLFNGAYSPNERDTIFLDADSAKPHMAVLGHELLHHMRTKSPEIYANLSSGLSSLIKGESKYRDKLEALTKRKGGEMPADWKEELHADIVGDYFTDPKFWEDLAKAEPSTFQKIANAVRQFLNTLLLKMRPFGTDAFLTDIQAARDVVSESMRKFSDAQIVNAVMETKPATTENEVVAKQEIRYSNEEKTALKELSQVDELFALPKSNGKAIAEIVLDNDPTIQVRETDLFGEKMYTLTMGDGSVARITERPPGKYGPNVYGYDMENGEVVNQITERPGVNPEDAPNVGDVWIDVSNLKRTGDGAKVYNIAATYAHNTGKIFIGDPAGLSVTALRRRLEQMISSALKFGTTDHLAPHPSQVRGGNGVPGLTWVYGDSEGNLERMLAASVAALDNAFPGSNAISFDPKNGNFYLTATGEIVPQRELAKRLELARARSEAGGLASAAEAGWRTVARGAVFRALARGAGEAARAGDGRSNGVLDQLREYGAGLAAREPLDRIFYSRADGDAGEVEAGDRRRATVDQLGFREPTTNSNGQPIARTPEALENFRKWFGDSKVVDADGRPLVVYRGRQRDYSVMRRDSDSSNFTYGNEPDSGGLFFHPDLSEVDYYMQGSRGYATGANVLPVYLSIQNPAYLSSPVSLEKQAKSLRDAEANGHDGAFLGNGDLVVFDPRQVKSAIGNQGTYDPSSPDIRFSLSNAQDWSIPDESRIDRLIYELQDSRIDLKRTQEAILGAKRQIEEKFDARLAETLYSGRVAYRDEQFLESEVEPLLAAMAVNRVGMNDLADYLHARGAEERNAQIARINPDLPDGGAGTNTQGVLMTNQAARDYLDSIPAERRKKLDFLASKVDAITKGTRELLVREGLEKPEVIQAWEAAYKNYVPMFRDEAESGNPHPTGGGFSVRGGNSKRATGSTKQVTNILAHVMMQRQAAITKAEKNRAALSLYGLALTNPNPEVWATIRPGMQASQIAADLKAMGVDPVVAEAGMQGVPTVRTVDPILDRVVDRPNPMYKSLPGALVVKIGGEDRVLMFNQDNPRALRMAESLKNLDGLTRMDLAGSIVGKATRWMASVNTQYNPAFGIVNGIRDTFGGAVNLTSTALRGKSAQVLLDAYTKAGPAIAKELANPGGQGEWAKLYRQFQEDGGKTGYREMFKDANDRAKALENQLKLLEKAGKLTPGKVATAILNLLDGFNTTIENAVRLSAYKNALDQGLSRAESARLARELTVDFNRKGRAGRELGPLYAFFNASVQGSARTLQALRGPVGAKIITGGLVLGAMQPLLLAMAGLDDDEIPEYVKTRAFIIPLFNKDKQYLAIPMPLGLHVIPNTGRVISELALNGGRDIGKRSFDAIGEVAGAFNPMGGGNIFTADGALRTISPTIIDPLIEVGFNKNFAGNQIERETRGETDVRPGFARARESTQRALTGQAYLGVSKLINKLTGGSDYEAGLASPSPERLQYFAQVVGGGVLREIEKTINLTDAAIKGDEFKQNKLPVVGRLFGEVDEEAVNKSRYYLNKARIEKAEAALRAADKAGDSNAMREMFKKYPELKMEDRLGEIEKHISELNKLAVATINDREKLKNIDKGRDKQMKMLNDAIKAIEIKTDGATIRQQIKDKFKNPIEERQTSAAQ